MKKYLACLPLLLLPLGNAWGVLVTISSGSSAKEEMVTYKAECGQAYYYLDINKTTKQVSYSVEPIRAGTRSEVDISQSELARLVLDETFFHNIGTSCGAGMNVDVRGFHIGGKTPRQGVRYWATIREDGQVLSQRGLHDISIEEMSDR